MGKYKKKPIVIEANQWFLGDESEFVIPLEKEVRIGEMTFVGKIRTLEDTDESCHYVCSGDYIVQGNCNDVWAVKENIFNETYVKVRKYERKN